MECPPEAVKALLHVTGGVDALTTLFNAMVAKSVWPGEWNELCIAPILKPNKDPSSPASYRPIHLEVAFAKLFSVIADISIRQCLDSEAILGPQYGFRQQRGTRDAVYIVKETLRRAKRLNKSTYCCFVDFTGAFDRVDRGQLVTQLKEVGVPPVWINMIEAMYTDVRACIGEDSRLFQETGGVKQGDPLSPLLFVIFISQLVTHLNAAAHTHRHRSRTRGRKRTRVVFDGEHIIL